MDRPVTFIGMDLGTFRTTVVSSNGKRAEVETTVGWPKDHIARSVLGRDVLFGKEVIEQRMACNYVRPFAKGALKFNDHEQCGVSADQLERHKEAAKLLVKHAVSLVEPAEGHAIFGVVGVPSRASIANKELIMESTREAFDAVMLAPEPFAVAYSSNQLTDALIVDIGAGTIDLCPMFGTFPQEEDQFTIPFGGDAIDEEFYQLITELYPEARISMRMARQIKEKSGFVHDGNDQVFVTLPVNGKPREFDVTKPLKQACSRIVLPIVDGIGQLISRYDPEIQCGLLSNIVLGGGGSQLKGLDQVLEEALQAYGGGTVTKVYDSVFAGAVGALKIAMNMPTDCWEQITKIESDRTTKTVPRRQKVA